MHLRSKTVQQLLSVILSVVMVLSMLPMEVLAQETPPVTTPMDLTAITEDTSGDGWSWTQSTKTLTLTGLTLTINGDIDQYEDMAKRKAAEEIDRSFAEPDAPEVNGDGEQ